MRDKEWLKRDIRDLRTEESEDFPHSLLVDRDDVLYLIDQLEEPESEKRGVLRNFIEANQEMSRKIEELESKNKKPVIPKFVANWFENDKKNMEIDDVFWQIDNCEMVDLDVDAWISENKNDFLRAWLDGYEIEKEKLYYVYDKTAKTYLNYNADRTRLSWYRSMFPNDTFTEAEIKAIDERYWAFAEEV